MDVVFFVFVFCRGSDKNVLELAMFAQLSDYIRNH